MKIYFVRHGQSQANLDRALATTAQDTKLTALGRDEAHEVGAKLREILRDRPVYMMISPARRTSETAQIIAEYLDVIESREDSRWMGLNFRGTSLPLDKYWSLLKDAHDELPRDVESPEQVARRVRSAMHELWHFSRKLPGAIRRKRPAIVVVSHDGIGRILRQLVKNLPIRDFITAEKIANGSVVSMEIVDVQLYGKSTDTQIE